MHFILAVSPHDAVNAEAVPGDLKHGGAVLLRVLVDAFEVEAIDLLPQPGAELASVQRHKLVLFLLHELHDVALEEGVPGIAERAEALRVVLLAELVRVEVLEHQRQVGGKSDQVLLRRDLLGPQAGQPLALDARHAALHLRAEAVEDSAVRAAVLLRGGCQYEVHLQQREYRVSGEVRELLETLEALPDGARRRPRDCVQGPVPLHHLRDLGRHHGGRLACPTGGRRGPEQRASVVVYVQGGVHLGGS
mmetsp:Transcript_11680/g.27756  ORF Transcript_11680/g.27756 Transcript_11680/m.27756 type:complete len:249 (+) Transcript_11680:1076-1822(+)